MKEVEAAQRLRAGGGRAMARPHSSGAPVSAPGGSVSQSLHAAPKASRAPVLRGAVRALARTAKYLLPDYAVVQIQHRRQMGRWANLHAPKRYSESILLRCLHPDLRWVELTDKLAVREYVREKIGDAHLIPLIAVPETFTREVFDALPNSFVMKANHGCSFVEVVRDKSKTSFEALNALAQRWLATDYYRILRERHYRFIKPRLFFEQLLVDESGKIPADLKVHVFGGRPEGPLIHTMIIADRFGDARGDIYDEHWHRMPVRFGRYQPSDAPVPRPSNWTDIERIARRLAEDFAYVRVDLYSTGNQVYFGELTFTPGAGRMPFVPESHEYFWARLLKESIEGFERMRRAGCL